MTQIRSPATDRRPLAERLMRASAWLLPITMVACLLRAAALIGMSLSGAETPAEPGIQVAAAPNPALAAVLDIAPAAGPQAASEPAIDPKMLLDVAAELKGRREQVERREQEITAREGVLKQAEQRIAAQIDQLEGLKAQLEGLLGKLSAEDEERIDRLVKVYEAMKPAKAGAIFDSTELRLLIPIVKRMREIKVAAIIEEMEPSRAQALTLELAQSKELPLLTAAPIVTARPARPAPGKPGAAGK